MSLEIEDITGYDAPGKCNKHGETTGYWVRCPDCGGEGGTDGMDLVQLDPSWYSEDDFEECETCFGEGAYWICAQCVDKPAEVTPSA